ncbi:MAG: rod shape-determining protein [Myxococcota bacterium]
MFQAVFGAFSNEMAIDLGTATTRIAVAGRDVSCCEASAVAIYQDRHGSRRILAVGDDALEMLGRCPPDIQIVHPIVDGVISDFEIAEAMLRQFMTRVQGRTLWVGPQVTVCVPYGTTDMERRAIRELAESSGARSVEMVEQPLAAASGAELPIDDACGHMVVDIGAGSTEIAVTSLGGVVYSRALKIGGGHMDRAIIHHIRQSHRVLIGPRTAEELKVTLGAALPSRKQKRGRMTVKGRSLETGYPVSLDLTDEQVHAALARPVKMIIDAVRASLEHTPPDLAADISQTGIVLAGGGAQLSRFDRALSASTGLPVIVPEDPELVVVRGALQATRLTEASAIAG